MKFRYSGVTKQREQVKGVIEAADEGEARLRLRSLQIRPEYLATERKKEKSISPFSDKATNLKGLILFSKQMSSLIESGVAIVQSLDILAQQERRMKFKNVLSQIKHSIEGGSGFADALAKFPGTFPEFYIRIIEAGELSGTLDEGLKRICVQLEKLSRLRAKVLQAVLYPLMTVVVGTAVLLFLLLKVIPDVAQLYGQNKLPDLTLFVVGLSAWVGTHFYHMGFAALAMGAIGYLLYQLDEVKAFVDDSWLKVPLFGPLALKSSVARFTRTMSTLSSSGVPFLTGFEICERVVDNLTIKKAIRDGRFAVAEGKGIAAGLDQAQVFPPMVIQMVSIGEMTGRLDELMGKVAEIYDDEVDDAVSNITTMIQPVLIIVIGALVAFLMLAMYLPLFSIGEKASGI